MVYDDPVTLALSGAFIMTGLLAFYAAILLSTAIPGDKIIYIVVLSIFVLIFLIFAYRLRRYGERQKQRIANRKHPGKDM
jgi:membrane protein implicated in regulation of membrane protease activity